MACVVLPSETARLVYGYLVKEKLDNIAIQFLENSPYLTDCYHIVKSGYHFNTKLLSKELHELIQEYSVIHNLVNKKIGLLPKTSSLYKRIKLNCESLSEIVDLILFRKFSISRNDDNSAILNKSKEKEVDQINDIKDVEKNINDSINNIAFQLEESLSSELANSRTEEKDKNKEQNEPGVLEEMQQNFHIKFSTKNNSVLEKGNVECDGESIASDIIEVAGNDETSKKCSSIENHNPVCEVLKENNDITLSLTDIDQNTIEKLNKIEISSISDEPNVNIDGKIKIVRIEKDNQQDQDKNQLSNALTQTLNEMDTGMNIENGSVLFVSPDVGNITINQDGNQIIVIPIDYYKPQAPPLGETENNNQHIQTEELVSCGEKSIETNNRTIFEDIATISSPVPTSLSSSEVGFSDVKKSLVDDNIITEATFLQNKDMIYELENKVKSQLFEDIASTPSVAPPVAPPVATPIAAPVVTTPVQTLILSQVIEQSETRFRRILPKNIEINPVVVVQPLIENNKVVMCKNKTNLKSMKIIPKKDTKKKLTKMCEKEATAKNMPNIKIPDEICPNKDIETTDEQIDENSVKNDTINEEKENLSANEKKTETPIVIVRKNSKRLSLSTPRRRRSHIRALEFTTPPKTKGEIKKSKTSPKLKVDEIKVTNKNVRNTLFKSPNSEIASKSSICLESEKKNFKNLKSIEEDINQTLTLSASATSTFTKTAGSFTSWDSDLRDFITSSSNNSDLGNSDSNENKRTRKPKRSQKNDKKPAKKHSESSKKPKALQISPSPSKINLTAKRNTYSISGTEEGSPVRSLLEELDLVTPFKDPDPIRSAEETPLTKLFRENINGIDIDLSMITTPVFPPTPSIIVTPDIEDSSALSGTCYYTPLKDNWKEKGVKNELHKSPIKDGESEQLKKKDTKETQEKVIGELVSKAKEIIGLGSEGSEENIIKKPLSGKVLSMVKIQMITQCDKKLCENIPINDEPNFKSSEIAFTENLNQESAKFDLKDELEEKKKRALRKIKSVKENLTLQTKKKVKRNSTKRKKNTEDSRVPKKLRRSSVNESNSISDEKTLESSESIEKSEVLHSTPYQNKNQVSESAEESSREKKERTLLDEIREDFPLFEDNGEFLELPMKTRKKLHYIKHFLGSKEVVTFLKNFDENRILKLKLKRSRRKFFQVFYKWLRHPHGHEVNKSEETKALFKDYLALFEKIKKGVSHKINEQTEVDGNIFSSEVSPEISSKSKSHLSDDEGELKLRTSNKKEDEIDEGPVSVLPLKKRKANVQPLGLNEIESIKPSSDKRKLSENPSRTQNFLQDIDVDRFLSQIHGQETR